jgi:hypothetical protein
VNVSISRPERGNYLPHIPIARAPARSAGSGPRVVTAPGRECPLGRTEVEGTFIEGIGIPVEPVR